MSPETQPHPSAAPTPPIPPAVTAIRRTIRRTQLRQIGPLADTTIYDMERCGEFPRRFYLTSKCVVCDLDEVQQ